MADKNRRSALIVDDDSMSRMILRAVLLDNEYEIVGEATNGKKGVELALELKPDVIWLDNVMPEMSGLDVLLAIRAKLPRALILMVTGSADRETVQAALQGGADGFVVKPFNSGRVLTALEQALAKARKPKAAP
jgi:two-component system chemotaxis response regulator CheY